MRLMWKEKKYTTLFRLFKKVYRGSRFRYY